LARRKLSRKQLVEPDQITTRLEDAVDWVMDHPRPFLWGIGGVVVIAVALTGWTLYANSRDEGAQAALGEVIRAYNDVVTYESDVARYQATLTEALEVDEAYGGMQAGRIARYYAALSHDGLGEADEAVRLLEELSGSSDAAIRPVARFALGQILKQQGEFDRAIDVFEQLLDSGEYAGPAVLFEIGQSHEAAGRAAEARTYYDTLLVNHPDSAYQAAVERALRRLGTPAGA
jgi:predicted negative regulator of RcsB-dependent stress response